jgi:hypothetical protein
MWVEESNGNGFVLTAKPEPHADPYQQSFFIATERGDPATHEYSVGNYGWYCFCAMNYWSNLWHTSANTLDRPRNMIRPGLYHFPNDSYATNSIYAANGYGMSYGYLHMNGATRTAFKSAGNGKIYYIKPVVCNSITEYTPAFQAQLFFPYDEGLGLMDGDIIAVDGSTVKYICKALDSPDSTTRLPFAMKYSQ